MPEKCESLEELRWMPGLEECDLKMYLRAARSMAAFAGMCDGGSAEDGCLAASRDDTTINALHLLHESNYDTGKALQALVKSPVPKAIDKKWSEEEQKRFVKGLRMYGKNFFKIRKELLSHKETPDLVEYYYLWKKTPQAATTRPHRRHRRCVLRRIRSATNNSSTNSNSTNPPSKSNSDIKATAAAAAASAGDVSSASEEEAQEAEQTDDSDSNINFDLNCSNCNTLAKELHQTGKDRSLLCNECRNYLKKFGEHRPVVVDKESHAKAISKLDDDVSLSNGKPNLRTRKGKESKSGGSGSTKYELNRGSSKSSETSSPERSEHSATENDSKANGTACDNELKKVDVPKRRHYSESNDVNSDQINESDKDFDGETKRRKHHSSDEKVTTELTVKEEFKSEKSLGDAEMTNVSDDSKNSNDIANDVEMKSEPVDFIKEESKDVKTDTEDEKPTLDSGDVAVKEEDESKEQEDSTDKDETDKSEIMNLKMESSSSPQDLSSLSTREKNTENVPSTSQASSSLAVSSLSSPVKKEDNVALNFSTTSNSKVSPSSSPNPLLYPFSQNPLAIPTTISERFPHLFPQFPYSLGLPPDAAAAAAAAAAHRQHFPPGSVGEKQQHEIDSKIKEEQSKSETSKQATPTSKSDSNRNLQSPKTTPSLPATFPSLAPPFASNEQFLMSHPNFASQLAASGGDRLPFANPLMNFPSGFPHIPFPLGPWSQYPRLPPGAFPPPYLQPPPNQMSSHSPHSQISKSKSPITSQSSSHHHSPSHFSSHSLKSHDSNKESFDRREREYQQDDDDMDNSYLHRGPSPEPKIEDSECHRSQSAIFLRHWNRGDYNSCARTDLTFKPVPESQLCRKREERARKAAEKEREDHNKKMEKSIEMKQSSSHSSNQANSSHDQNSHISPLGGRHTPRNFDTPALRQLSEYARPHTAYSPFSHPSIAHHMNPSSLNQLGIHGPTQPGFDQMAFAQLMLKERYEAEEKQKMAMLEKQKELEMKSRQSQSQQHNSNLPPTSSANSLMDQHIFEMQRRMAANSSSLPNNPSTSSANGLPISANNPSGINPFMLFSSNERAAQEQMQQMAAAAMADRLQADRLALSAADPFIRLQMGLNPEMHGGPPAPNPAHAFQHPSAHSVHQPSAHSSGSSNVDNAAAAASMQLAAMGLPGSQYDPALHATHPLLQSPSYPSRPPSIMPRPELAQSSALYRSFDENLSHQLSAQALQQEQLQRQLMSHLERERLMAAQLHSSSQHQQLLQDEFLRQREMKFRSLEEAARSGRPM